MIAHYAHHALHLWQESLISGGLILVCVGIGWHLAHARGGWLIGGVSWWLEHVVRPVMESRTWLRRAGIIAANNTFVCASLVLLGTVSLAAWIGLAGVGLSLGAALRLMFTTFLPEIADETPQTPRWRAIAAVGLALNLLEIPAILLSGGLSLAQGALTSAITTPDAMMTFLVIGVPLLLVSAAGEATWMAVSPHLPRPPATTEPPPEPDDHP